jgi:hypothetical protein
MEAKVVAVRKQLDKLCADAEPSGPEALSLLKTLAEIPMTLDLLQVSLARVAWRLSHSSQRSDRLLFFFFFFLADRTRALASR